MFSSCTVVAGASAVTEHQDNLFPMLEENVKPLPDLVGPWTSTLTTVRRQKPDILRSQNKLDHDSTSPGYAISQATSTHNKSSPAPTPDDSVGRRISLTNSSDVESFPSGTAVSRGSRFGQELTFRGGHASRENSFFEALAVEENIEHQNRISGNEFQSAVLKNEITDEVRDSTNRNATKLSTYASSNTDVAGIATGKYQLSMEPADVTAVGRRSLAGAPKQLTKSADVLDFKINKTVLVRRARNIASDISDSQDTTLNPRHLVTNYSPSDDPDALLTSRAYSTDSAPEPLTGNDGQTGEAPMLTDDPVTLTTQKLSTVTPNTITTIGQETLTQTPKMQILVSMSTADILSATPPTYQLPVSLTDEETVGGATTSLPTTGSGEFTYTAPPAAVGPFTASPKDAVTIPHSTHPSSTLPTVDLTLDDATGSQSPLEPGYLSRTAAQQTLQSGQSVTSSPGEMYTHTETIQEKLTSPDMQKTTEMAAGTVPSTTTTSSNILYEGVTSEVPPLITQRNHQFTRPPPIYPETWTHSEEDHKTEGRSNTAEIGTDTVTPSIHTHQQRRTASLDGTEVTGVVGTATPNPASSPNTMADDRPSNSAATQNPLLTTASTDDIGGTFETKPTFLYTAEESTTPGPLSQTPTSNVPHATNTGATVSPVDAENSSYSFPTSAPVQTSVLTTPKEKPEGTGRKTPELTPTMESPEAYPSVNGVRVRLGLDANYNTCVRGREWQFREHIRRQLSVLLRVPLPGVRNVRVRPGSILVEADVVPVRTSTLELDKPALLAARRDLQERIDRGTVVVLDLDGNRLPVFTSTVYSLQPPHGTSYSPALLGALTAMFLAAASVIVASACLAKRHIGERHISPSPPEREFDLEQQTEPQFLRLVSPSLLISTRLEDPASISILRDTRMLPRRSLVPEPPVYKPARDNGDALPVAPPPPVLSDEPSVPLSAATWQSHPFESPVSPSDAFSLEPWSTTPSQSRSEVISRHLGSGVTSQWTTTPSGRWTSHSENGSEKTSSRPEFADKRVRNGHVR